MEPLIGTFDCDLRTLTARATLILHPGAFSTFPWSHCAATADFLARLVCADDDQGVTFDVVSYALNELVENAVKFSSTGPIEVSVGRLGEDVVCVSSNHVTASSVPGIRARLERCFDRDPSEALVRQVHATAPRPPGESGLGLLTLLGDHQAELGFRFARGSIQGHALLTTLARLPSARRAALSLARADYKVWFEEPTGTIHIEGSIRLRPREYEPLWRILTRALDRRPAVVTLKLDRLIFLNSSGINTLYRFAVELRTRGDTRLVVETSDAPWQQKMVPNLARFLPGTIVRVLSPA